MEGVTSVLLIGSLNYDFGGSRTKTFLKSSNTRYHLARQGCEALLYIREWTVELLSSPTPDHVSSRSSSFRPPSGRGIGSKSMIFSEFGFQKMTPKRGQNLLNSGYFHIHIPVANARK